MIREVIRIEGESGDARAAIKQTETALDRMQASVRQVAGAAGLGFLAVSAVRVGRQMIDFASDLNESTSKSIVVFGNFSDEIMRFAETGPQALGLSTQAALEATATFGNLFTAMQLSQAEAAKLSPAIVRLGADFASFNNVPVEEALLAIRSGLVGEAEPLRKFGVLLNEATTQAKAMELGLVDASGKATEAGKVQARFALIMEQSTNAQGDFARTAEGTANATKTATALFQNMQATVGQKLLPVMDALLDVVPIITAAFSDNSGAVDVLVETLVPLIEGVGSVIELYGTLSDALDKVTGKLGDAADNAATFADDLPITGIGAFGKVLGFAGESASALNEVIDYFIGTQPMFSGLIERSGAVTRDMTRAMMESHPPIATITVLQDKAAIAAGTLATNVGKVGDALDDATTAHENFGDSLRAAADPVFAAIDSWRMYEDTLATIDEDTHQTTEEMLALAKATLDSVAAFGALDESTLAEAIDAIATALNISADAAERLLVDAGLLDGMEIAFKITAKYLAQNVEGTPLPFPAPVSVPVPSFGGGIPVAHEGGTISGVLGQARPILALPGETVLDRSLTTALERWVSAPQAPAQVTVIIHDPGIDPEQVEVVVGTAAVAAML